MVRAAFAAGRPRDPLHRSSRHVGNPTGVWTVEFAAEVSLAQGLTVERGGHETIRATLQCQASPGELHLEENSPRSVDGRPVSPTVAQIPARSRA